jgi:hypothetical protein
MDYSRFNYVAQPEDKIDPKLLIPGIGPYDKWATKWGYAPIAGAKSADEEKKTLDAWAREQDEKPYLRFSTADSRGSDPGELTEAVGDADAVQATTLGIKNLEAWRRCCCRRRPRPARTGTTLRNSTRARWGSGRRNSISGVDRGGLQSQQKHGGQAGGSRRFRRRARRPR